MPPGIAKGEPYAVDEGYLSDLHRFITLMMSMPPMSGVDCDMDVDIETVFESGPSDGENPTIILFMDPMLQKYFLLKKDLNLESLGWYLLL